MALDSQTPGMTESVEQSALVMPEEEIRQKMSEDTTGEFVNKVLSGEVAIGETSPVENPQTDMFNVSSVETSGVDENPTEAVVPEEVISPQTEVEEKELTEEERLKLEEERRYSELRSEIDKRETAIEELNRRYREEREALVQQQGDVNSRLENERKERERLEELVKQLSEEQKRSKSTGVDEEDDDEYASDYSKQNRQMLKELRQDIRKDVEKLSNNDPKNLALEEKLQKIERYEQEIERKKAEEERKARQDKLYSSVESFQNKYEEFKTKKPINQLDAEVRAFKKQVGLAANVNSTNGIEKAVNDYFNGKSNKAEQLRERLNTLGVVPPEDTEKFLKLAHLVDLKNGSELNEVTGELIPIKDSYGNKVRYRSLEEAYRVSHYFDEINRARVEEAKKIQNKLMAREESAITIGNINTSPSTDVITSEDQIRQLINTPPQAYERDPELKRKVAAAYGKLGMTIPKLGGH